MSGEPENSRRRSSRLEFHFLAIQISGGTVTAAVVANARTTSTVCDVMLEIFFPTNPNRETARTSHWMPPGARGLKLYRGSRPPFTALRFMPHPGPGG